MEDGLMLQLKKQRQGGIFQTLLLLSPAGSSSPAHLLSNIDQLSGSLSHLHVSLILNSFHRYKECYCRYFLKDVSLSS